MSRIKFVPILWGPYDMSHMKWPDWWKSKFKPGWVELYLLFIVSYYYWFRYTKNSGLTLDMNARYFSGLHSLTPFYILLIH